MPCLNMALPTETFHHKIQNWSDGLETHWLQYKWNTVERDKLYNIETQSVFGSSLGEGAYLDLCEGNDLKVIWGS